MSRLETVKASKDSPMLNEVRWRTMQWVYIIASLGMVPLILTGKDYQWSTIGSLILVSLGFAILAISQGLLKRVSTRLEAVGLLLASIIFIARFTRIIDDVIAQDLPPEALADIFPWAAVIYAAMFIVLANRVAILFALAFWLLSSSYALFNLGTTDVIRGLEPSIDLSVSGLIMILILSVFRRLIEVGARAQARAETMAELATKDSLTGLYNRRFLDEKLGEEFVRSVRYQHPLSVAICDIDFFKTINDQFSHEVGDVTLKELSQLLQNNIRQTDILSRYGGEEFVIVFPETGKTEAVNICEKLCQIVAEYSWQEVHPDLKVTISIGVSDDLQLSDHEKLLHKADIKLYEAKHRGKNQVCY